jgi:hypothetical protein
MEHLQKVCDLFLAIAICFFLERLVFFIHPITSGERIHPGRLGRTHVRHPHSPEHSEGSFVQIERGGDNQGRLSGDQPGGIMTELSGETWTDTTFRAGGERNQYGSSAQL